LSNTTTNLANLIRQFQNWKSLLWIPVFLFIILMGSLSNSVDEEFWEGIKQLIVA